MLNWYKRIASWWAVITIFVMLLNPAAAMAGGPGLPSSSTDGGFYGRALHEDMSLLLGKIDSQLLDELSGGGRGAFWISIDEAPDLGAASSMTWVDRGQYVYEQLTETARKSQARVVSLLDGLGLEYKPFWILNTIYVPEGDMEALTALVSLSEVSEIVGDEIVPLVEPEPGTYEPTARAAEWGVIDIGAIDVWSDFGVRGDGIVLGSIDTGVFFEHEALVEQYRGNTGGGDFDHNYNWHDPTGLCGSTPCDNDGHGTHTVGTMLGDDGGDNQIGVAPGARWIAAKGCEGRTCSTEALLSSMQFMLAPTDLQGENPDPGLRPHIVNNSWGGSIPNPDYQTAVQHWVAAGIFPVFSNGNSGPVCGTVGSPALFPESYAVGNYTSSHTIAGTSSRGPSPAPYDVVKPNISAPGTNVRSAWNDGTYMAISGTSMAAPHVAGAVALLWSGTSLIGDIDGTREILDATAVTVEDLRCGGDPEFNNVWGRGRLDVLEAFKAVDGDAGFIIGTVTDANDGDPIRGADVTVLHDGEVLRYVKTDAEGGYRFRLPLGEYSLEVSAQHYELESDEAVVEETGEEVTIHFSLHTAQVTTDPDALYFEVIEGAGDAATLTLVNGGTLEADFELAVPVDPRAAEESWLTVDVETGSIEPGGYTTVTVTADAAALAPGIYEGSIIVNSNSGRRPEFAVPVEVIVLLANAGWVEGVVTDANDGEPVAGATITAVGADGETVHVETADEDGKYRFQLYLGDYTIEGSAKNYGTESQKVDVEQDGGEYTIDLSLPTAIGGAHPDGLEFSVVEGETETKSFTLSNTGTREMIWSIKRRPASIAADGFTDGSLGSGIGPRRDPAFSTSAATTEGMYVEGGPAAVPAGAGKVLQSWDTGLASPWGVGYDGSVIISNTPGSGGDSHDHKFTTGGDFITKWSTESWQGAFAADMAYDDTHNLIWQVNVGGDNCLYGLDPDDGTVRETICGSPWDEVSQRGVAYRSDDDTLYVGGWNEDIIYHIKGLSYDNPGEVIEQYGEFSPGSISGLAWDPVADVLWVATNSIDDNIYALAPDAGWALVAVVGHPEEGSYNGAGLSSNDDGNLWMISRGSGMAYLVESDNAKWVLTDPLEGVVPAGESITVDVTVDAADLDAGNYEAELVVRTDAGRDQNLSIGITAEVIMAPNAFIQGTVTDANDGEPVAGALIEAHLPDGTQVDVTATDENGAYELHLYLGEYVITASVENYGTESVQVILTADDAVYVEDFELDTARGEVDPAALEFTVPTGGTGSAAFTLRNVGGLPMEWSLVRKKTAAGYAGGGAGPNLASAFRGKAAAPVSPENTGPEPGDVLKSWDTGLPWPWGIGYDGDITVGNPPAGTGGDSHNYKFTVDGEFITKWPTLDWEGQFAAGMTYDDTHDLLWQVNVGGDNCLYGMDPDNGTVEEVICGSPWDEESQRGVAYRPDDDTFYIGGWVENIIYRIKGLSHDNPGEVIEQVDFAPGSLADLAWNPTAEVLWALTNARPSDIYALSPKDDWAVVTVLGHPEPTGNVGGMSMDDEGNLWLLARRSGMAYLVYSGMPHDPTAWLAVEPREGTIAPGGDETVTVDVDAAGLEPGTYGAELRITTNGGRETEPLVVAVTMHVVELGEAPELTVTEPGDGAHTNADTITVKGAAVDPAGGEVTVMVNGEEADVEADGGFVHRILLPEEDGPFTITVTAIGENGGSATEERTVVVDRTPPVLDGVTPAEDVVLEWGEVLTISFRSEPGLAASYQLIVDAAGWLPGADGLPGVAMEEVEDGLYIGTYTAPEGASFSGAEIEIYAGDKAGNITRVMAEGTLTVVTAEPEPVDPPVLIITGPAEGFLTNRDAVRVSGVATDEQEGQEIVEVSVNGRAVHVADDGSFTTRIILWEGDNTISVTATNTAGETAIEQVTVTADWTAPELTDLDPAEDIILARGQEYTFRFESEPGLTAAYQIVVGGRHGTWITRGIPVKGTPMTEVQPGVYEATYTAPEGVLLDKAIIQFNAADAAGNVIMITAPGEMTVVGSN